MAQYRVLSKSFINNRIVEEGETVEFDGKAGSNLELIKAGKKGEKHGVAPVEDSSQPDQSEA
jgi:hypothetical protein